MKVYLSHSYRDVSVNGYFLERFIDDEVTLFADQKTDVWCVAKLERYLGELDGFVSIVTHCPEPDGMSGFSFWARFVPTGDLGAIPSQIRD